MLSIFISFRVCMHPKTDWNTQHIGSGRIHFNMFTILVKLILAPPTITNIFGWLLSTCYMSRSIEASPSHKIWVSEIQIILVPIMFRFSIQICCPETLKKISKSPMHNPFADDIPDYSAFATVDDWLASIKMNRYHLNTWHLNTGQVNVCYSDVSVIKMLGI